MPKLAKRLPAGSTNWRRLRSCVVEKCLTVRLRLAKSGFGNRLQRRRRESALGACRHGATQRGALPSRFAGSNLRKTQSRCTCQLCCGARNQRTTLERREGNRRRVQTSSFAVVIRCLLRLSNELRRAVETLNRYIGGGRKRDETTDLRGIENS